MPRGGARAGAGRKPTNPKTIAKRAATGLTTAAGKKAKNAPASWPFGKAEVPLDQALPEADKQLSFKTPMEYWEHVLADPGASASAKQSAAYSLAPYVHAKLALAGKKDVKNDAAKKAGGGKFSPSAPPKLVVNNR